MTDSKRVTPYGLRMSLGNTCGVLIANALTDAIFDALPATSADTLRDRVRKALHDWGLDALTADPPHDWRCQYTDRFPEPCTCVDDLVEDIVEAVYGPQEAKP